MERSRRTEDVAAAILLNRGGPIHIEELTRLVMDSELATVGLRASEPIRSLRAILNKKPEWFSSWGGFVELVRNNVADDIVVSHVLECYRNYLEKREREMSKDDLIKSLKNELQETRGRNQELLGRLARIAELCGSETPSSADEAKEEPITVD